MTMARGMAATAPRTVERATEALRWIARAGVFVHVASLPISMAGMQAGFAIAAIALVLLRVAGVPVWRRSLLDLPILAFVGAALLSQLLAFAWMGGDAFLWKTLLSPLVIVSALGLDPARARRDALRLLGVWAVAAMVPAILAWPQYYTGFDLLHALGLRKEAVHTTVQLYRERYNALGLFSAHTRLAHALLAPVCVLAAVAPVAAKGARRTLAPIVLAAIAAAIVLTFARSAWYGLVAAGAVLSLFAGGKRAVAGFAALAVAGALLVSLHPGVRTRFASSFDPSRNQDRKGIWQVCADVAKEHPWTGVGFGNLPVAAREKFDGNAIIGKMGEKTKRRCHNAFFTSLAEGGPLLFAASIFLIAGPAWSFLRLRRRTDRLGAAACAGALAMLAAMFVNSLVHDPLYASEAGFAFGFALAAAALVAATPTPGSDAEAPAAA